MIRLRNELEHLAVRIYSRFARRSFDRCGAAYIHPTARITNPHFMRIGNGVRIGTHAWIYAMDSDSAGRTYKPMIEIGSGTRIGDFAHVTCASRLSIGADVLMTRNVLITDSIHAYDDPSRPVIAQGLSSKPTSVGDGCWLGNNSVIIRCSVGRNCVVAANAVVTEDVPDFCVVAGVPARIVRRYNPESRQWEKNT